MYPYRRMEVWKRAHALAVSTYGAGVLDESGRFRSLVEQLRRSAVSVTANIAEGAGCGTQAMFARYLGIALASAYELEAHLILARDISCLSAARADLLLPEIESVIKMLTAFHRTVKSHARRRTPAV